MNMHDDTFQHVRQFQFYQDTPGKAVLRVVPSDGFGREDYKRVLTNLGKKFDGRLEFVIELRNAIPLSSRGKAIYVDQKINR
jgi:phenylacetate-CoA ligase